MMDDKDVTSTLNKLIETCKDGEYGFRLCAEHVRAPELKTVFEQRASDCQRGAEQLQQAVRQYGGQPDEGGSASGAVHRGWVSAKGKLVGSSDVAMLEECERGEDVAMARYRDALEQPLPADVRAIVERQFEGVKRNHAQVRDLRNRYRAAA
jgi:uncharacterized protein (TIGR02284 family)